MMHSALYAVTSEVFSANHRGTGNGLTAFLVFWFVLPPRIRSHIFMSKQAPIIALYANLNTSSIPVYIAGGLVIAPGGLVLLLPFEPRGKVSI